MLMDRGEGFSASGEMRELRYGVRSELTGEERSFYIRLN